MAKVGVDDLYFGTESWDVQGSATQFMANFDTLQTRNTALGKQEYSNNPKISVFVSEQTIKELTGSAGGTLRPNVKGIVLLFGYDGSNSNLVLIARSANGRAARPADTSFTNINYKAPNTHLDDTAVVTLSDAFATPTGYEKLAGWPDSQHPVFAFDSDILLLLLYSNAARVGGQVNMHIVVAPPWSDDLNSGPFISIVAQKDNVFRGDPPCPPYCYQNV